MEVNDLHVGRKLFVSSGIGAPGTGVVPSPPPTALTVHPGSAWIENALLVGAPETYPSPGLEAQLMVGRCPKQNLTSTAISIFKVSSRASAAPTGTPLDVMLGDPSGPVGVQIYGGATNAVIVQAKDLIFTAITAEQHAALQKNTVTTSSNEAEAAKSDTGTKSNNGTEANTGAVTDQTATLANGPVTKGGTPDFGSAEVATAAATLNTTNATAQSALSLAGKGFDIPHPTKDEHRLRYICLEGPEVGAYFRGTLRGTDTIDLPEYWRELVYPESITVNLTPIGYYQELYVDENVQWGTRIKVKTNSGSKINCHFTVFGERRTQDKLQVEYKGLTPDDYPGDNTEYALGGWDYARHKGEPKSPSL
jgi:hypothetical protein